LTLDQAHGHAAPDNLLKDFLKDARLPKAPVAVLGKGRVIGNLLLKAQSSEPTVGKMHPHFVHQAPLAGDPVQIADQQQAQQHFRINRRSSGRAVEVLQALSYEAQIHMVINESKKVILGDLVF
jgi:hypothetical protein